MNPQHVSQSTKGMSSIVTQNSGRDVNHPASPQPQHNSGHSTSISSSYSQYPPQQCAYSQPQKYHHQVPQTPPPAQTSTQHHQLQPPPQQQTRAPQTSSHPRRGSTDRGAKDPSKMRSTTPKLAPDHVGPYMVGKTLGKGSSGCVKLGRHRKTNEQVAVKIISKASLANKAAVHRGIEREIAIMKLINHPHVIRLYDVYETEKELFLVMEYVSGGELFEYLVNKGRLDETEALRFFQQIIVGLAFCHKRKICHRDLKPENLLLDERMNVKIADFGMASLQKTGRLLETSCGSPHYASPEVVTGMKYDGSSSDIWSCGIILYALLTGHLPFDDENIRQLLSKVKAGKFYMPTDISPGARDLISRMLTVNPKRRITMQGVMMHPWFRMVNPDRNTLGEPAEDPEGGRQLLEEELDAEIVRHMRWLFAPGPSHSDPEAKEIFDEEALLLEIQEKLTSSEENMEKLFYHLLCQHKTELLENYVCDENESVLDGPRRRADSFPNSAMSVRSRTPDLHRSSLSSSTTPGSPLSPTFRCTPIDPSPLSMTPIEPLSAAKIASAVAKLTSKPARSKSSSNSSGVSDKDASRVEYHQDVRTTARTTTKPRGISNEDDSSNADESEESQQESLSPKLIKINVLGSERSLNRKPAHPPTMHHITVISPKPISPVAQRSSIIAVPETARAPMVISSPSTPVQGEEIKKEETDEIMNSVEAALSMESVVLSTQISETSNSSACRSPELEEISRPMSPAVVPKESNATTIPTAEASTRTPTTTTKDDKPERPILRPLDVKVSAGIMATNVSAHSRKYSEGSASVHSATSMSPGPKRPWFARLFDFKPQPLTFKSNWSAAETQERLEAILRDVFQSSIQVDSFKKPSFGIKCRYEGGTINDQAAKAVKFKIEITEKTTFMPNHPSNNGVMLMQNSNHSQHHLPVFGATAVTLPPPSASTAPCDYITSRRASDGGSILSSAAAAMSTSLAARNPFSSHHHNHAPHALHLHQHSSSSSSSPSPSSSGYPPLPSQFRVVKVTLHQQQGANSTLRMVHEQLCLAWELLQVQQQMGSECSFVAIPPATMAKAPRAAAM
ncbi:Serine/threonine-protein kinase brsk1 [Podila clonocystis]|nr:Serine/threonine-protein kinase brsk1 [Podila clonocystis]